MSLTCFFLYKLVHTVFYTELLHFASKLVWGEKKQRHRIGLRQTSGLEAKDHPFISQFHQSLVNYLIPEAEVSEVKSSDVILKKI